MNYYAYILSNKSQTIYAGMTNNIARRLAEHRCGQGGEFTAKYQCHQLV